ncbi:MAG: DUF1622 domain-containing protein [Pseudomonadota bacterium]
MPNDVRDVLDTLTLLVDGVGYAILFYTVIRYVFRFALLEVDRLRGWKAMHRHRELRVDLLNHMVLGLDFIIIGDVILAGTTQTRESLIRLVLVTGVRAAFALFIYLEMREIRRETVEDRDRR